MKSLQYTIRAVSPKLDRALRARAQKTGKSLNETALEALAKGVGVSDKPVVYHDLDWFIGAGKPDPKFDEAMRWLDNMPKELE